MRYVVETRMGNTWEAVWSEDQEPMVFDSEEEAEVEIAETLEDLQEAYEQGDMSSPMTRDEFRIVMDFTIPPLTNYIKSRNKNIVISLYDFTGEACLPWAKAGYECYCFDIQHEGSEVDYFPKQGRIHYRYADLHNRETYDALIVEFGGRGIALGMAFPVCTDLAVSGAAWFAKKAEADPDFQIKAVNHAVRCAAFFEVLDVPYFIENPVSVLATKWRKPDHMFHPFEYGGYISTAKAEHPRWPEYIAPYDAYKKKTCLWTGGGFKMPDRSPVLPEEYLGNGYSTAMMKLGGKSQRTKDIRRATPRGFAKAVYAANAKGENQ